MNLRDLVAAEEAGQSWYSSWRKAPAVVTSAGFWMDLSMSPGNPAPNYYVASALTATPLALSTDGGLYHARNVAPATKYLRSMRIQSVTAGAVPMTLRLCDYLLFYPFVDESLVDEPQPMDNTLGLTRSTDGEGVQIMAVVTNGHATGGSTFTVSYTNSAGVAGRTTVAATMNTQFVTGTILTSAVASQGTQAPFLTLQAGDTGVRSIESVTVSGTGDVGLFCLVLVKPLANLTLRGIDAPAEYDHLMDWSALPVIEDDAYLGLLALVAGSITGAAIHGDIRVAWV
jgi:hypothetical protein